MRHRLHTFDVLFPVIYFALITGCCHVSTCMQISPLCLVICTSRCYEVKSAPRPSLSCWGQLRLRRGRQRGHHAGDRRLQLRVPSSLVGHLPQPRHLRVYTAPHRTAHSATDTGEGVSERGKKEKSDGDGDGDGEGGPSTYPGFQASHHGEGSLGGHRAVGQAQVPRGPERPALQSSPPRRGRDTG